MKCNLVNYECKHNKNGWCDKHHTQIKMLIDRGDTCIPNTGVIGHKATQIIVDELPPELLGSNDVVSNALREYSKVSTISDNFGFDNAFHLLKEERRMARRVWPKGDFIHMQVPNSHSYMKQRYLYRESLYAGRVPWLPTFEDLFANDWYEVDYEE